PVKDSFVSCKAVLYRNLVPLRIVIDLNFEGAIRSAGSSGRRPHEQRTVPLFAIDRSSTQPRVSQVCATLRGQLPGTEFFVLGPVSLHGICAVDLPRESARHRGLPALAGTPTLSSGDSRHSLAQH